jgi:hypothetical protein
MSQHKKTFRRRFFLLFSGCYPVVYFVLKVLKALLQTFDENFNIEFAFSSRFAFRVILKF